MVLNARDKLFALFAIVIAASALLVAHGCVSRDPQRARQSGFAHAPHVESGMACDSCHRSSEGDSAGMPTWAVCHVCHGKSERREPLAFEIAIQGYDPQVPFRRESGTVFDLHAAHEAHERAGIACSTCHGDASEPMPRYDAKRCGDCHGERGVKRDCETCHRELRPDVAPPSHHGAGWIETHGEEARFRHGSGSGHGDVCALCHAESDCLDCHRVTPPANHTMFFRQRGHGLVASIEREECTACHQESFCVTCHREERPRSHHRAGWGGSTSIHCLSCHEPGGESSCIVCHKQAPSHLFATPVPPPPHPSRASDCYRCHLRPPHADNGMDCAACHR